MTSILNVDEIAAKNGTSPVALTKQQANKGHFSYNQATNTLATETFNMSSATDKSTGKFNVSYSNAMAQANHPVTYLADAANFHWDEGEDARTTTNTGTFLNWNSAHNSNIDTQFSTAATHGDLA